MRGSNRMRRMEVRENKQMSVMFPENSSGTKSSPVEELYVIIYVILEKINRSLNNKMQCQ